MVNEADAAPPTEPDWNAVAQALQTWASGQQDAAIAQLQPIAETGPPGLHALMAWMLHQLGEPRWREAIPHVEAAMRGGYAQAASFIVGNMMNDATLRERGLEIARQAAQSGVVVVDPIGQASNFAQQGDTVGMASLLSTPWPMGVTDPSRWSSLITTAESAVTRTQGILQELSDKREATLSQADAVVEAAQSSEQRVREQTTQLLELITQTTNAQAASFFEGEATTSATQANKTWSIGVGVISFAAFLGVAPLLLHYFALVTGMGSTLPRNQALSAHVTATLALATVAGVILTRSRVRDRNRQRNKDLSVALRTMFAYGTQIEDVAERQKFVHDMGRTVIEAYLNHDPGREESVRNLLSLLPQRG